MAFGLRYRITGNDKDGNALRVDILQNGWGGAFSTYPKLIAEGFSVHMAGLESFTAYVPVRPIEATFWMMDTGTVQNAILATGQLEYQAHLYVDGTLVHKTYVKPRLDYTDKDVGRSASETGTVLFEVAVELTCGLSLLQHFPFLDDGDLWEGSASVRTVMQQCLAPLEYEMPINFISSLYSPGITTGEDPIEERDVDQDYLTTSDGYPPSCAQVLQDLCVAHGLELMQMGGEWWAVQVDQFAEDSLPVHRYTDAGTHSTPTALVPQEVQIHDELANRIAGTVHPALPALDRVVIALEHQRTPYLIRNPTFDTYQRGFDRSNGGGALYDHAERRRSNEGRSRGTYTGVTGGPRSWSRSSAPSTVPVTGPVDYWRREDDGNPTYRIGYGPDGQTVLELPLTDAGTPAPSDPDGIHFADADKYYHNSIGVFTNGRHVLGGTGRSLIWQASSFVDVYPTGSGNPYNLRYPVYAQLFLVSAGGGASGTNWLQNDGSWSTSEVTIKFAEVGGNEGILPQQWNTMAIESDEIPSGTWSVNVRLYGAIDVSADDDMVAHYWMDVFCDIIVDGIIAPSAEVVTVKRDTSLDLLAGQFSARFGTTPVRDMPGAVQVSGAMIADILNGAPYDTEDPTGISQQEAVARMILSMQAQPLKNRRATYHSDVPLFDAHRPIAIMDDEDEDDRFRLGDWTWNYRSRTQGGTLIQVKRTSPAVTVTRVVEPS